ncbi:MAG: hypothetical protein HDR27_06310, partial [Lachnospiraceae bacterium]|nr:hypothetical protein [Lachnospiraceae bacterium]
MKDADRYNEAVQLLLQRYLSYYADQEWSAQRNPEKDPSGYLKLETVYDRLLAGDKQEAVFAVIFRYHIGYGEEELSQFPQELRSRARIAQEKSGYYAYFNWTVRICMVQDYVFELEGIAETEDVMEAYAAQGQAVSDLLGDVPTPDLLYGIDDEKKVGSQAEDIAENAYQVDTSEDVLKVSGADGEWMEVPITLEELYGRGDEMDGKLTSLQEGSYQVDENKIIFAYGGSNKVPFSVVFYEEESQ